MYASRTRFITNAMLPLFDHLPRRRRCPRERRGPAPQAPGIDVARRVRGLFS